MLIDLRLYNKSQGAYYFFNSCENHNTRGRGEMLLKTLKASRLLFESGYFHTKEMRKRDIVVSDLNTLIMGNDITLEFQTKSFCNKTGKLKGILLKEEITLPLEELKIETVINFDENDRLSNHARFKIESPIFSKKILRKLNNLTFSYREKLYDNGLYEQFYYYNQRTILKKYNTEPKSKK